MDEPKRKELEDALKERETGHYVLRLYVAGLNRISSGPSKTSIKSVKSTCRDATSWR
jgi:hypothetical protein